MRDSLRSLVCRRPEWVVVIWFALAVLVGLLAPDLSRLAAEGQAKILGQDAESLRAAEVVRRAWPEQSFVSLAVVALHRAGGLSAADSAYARRLAARFEQPDRPREIVRVMGPSSAPEVAARLVSPDRTAQLVAVAFGTSFVGPDTHDAVAWLESQALAEVAPPPPRLEILWTGDAVLGRDYMAYVRTSLDRAALATVGLLLIVLLAVYRSIWLALVPLVTIGACVVIARGLLAWMVLAGWEISPLVELFLVAVLFGTGTDFCLFVSWRFAEQWDPDDPAAAMRVTLRRALVALATSAGTVIVGLALMGTTRFKLFSSTGPSVALGLALTLVATLTLTPALLLLLARWRPRSFVGLSAPSSQFWDRLARRTLARPVRYWAGTLLALSPFVVLGLRTGVIQDLLIEMPVRTPSAGAMRLLATKFGPGLLTPLSVVLEADGDLRQSWGLALIDDLSRFLAHQRRLAEIRSATQPLGSPAPLGRARLRARLGEVNDGFARVADGARQLEKGLEEGAAKLRATIWLESATGLNLTGTHAPAAVGGRGTGVPARNPSAALPRDAMVRDLAQAGDGARQIAEGAVRAHHEVAAILNDPVGQHALDHLLIDAETVHEHPELLRSFAAYITPDGRRARIDLVSAERMFSGAAMDQVQALRRLLRDFLSEVDGYHVRATIAGPSAEAADVRALTRADQFQSWFVVPAGVFLVLLLALRDPLACMNLVATMVVTYLFALGVTHVLFVTVLGAPGIDWKVPYFLFVLLVALGVDYNVFLMTRLREEVMVLGLRFGIIRAVAQTGGLISSAAAITACSFASFLFSPLSSLRQLGFALVIGIAVDALVVRPLLVPCGHWLLNRRRDVLRRSASVAPRKSHHLEAALAD